MHAAEINGMTLHRELREFIESLNSANFKYVIVGGCAVAYHGHPRMTGDIGIQAADFLKPDMIIQLGRPPHRIDIMTGMDAVTFDEAWQARVAASLDDVPVHFIDKDLLLRNKRATGRAQDQADAEKIEGETE